MPVVKSCFGYDFYQGGWKLCFYILYYSSNLSVDPLCTWPSIYPQHKITGCLWIYSSLQSYAVLCFLSERTRASSHAGQCTTTCRAAPVSIVAVMWSTVCLACLYWILLHHHFLAMQTISHDASVQYTVFAVSTGNRSLRESSQCRCHEQRRSRCWHRIGWGPCLWRCHEAAGQ